jgi:hypothetical protein
MKAILPFRSQIQGMMNQTPQTTSVPQNKAISVEAAERVAHDYMLDKFDGKKFWKTGGTSTSLASRISFHLVAGGAEFYETDVLIEVDRQTSRVHILSKTAINPCFPAGTLVATVDHGEQPIETLNVGDRIWSYDENTSHLVKSVIKHVKKSEGILGTLKLSNGQEIKATMNHPFYVAEKEGFAIKRLDSLIKGDKLISSTRSAFSDDGSTRIVEVSAVETDLIEEVKVVYNLSVDTFENYFVFGVLTHNY